MEEASYVGRAESSRPDIPERRASKTRPDLQEVIRMDHFTYRNRVLHCEDVPVPELAGQYGTPLYLYSTATLLHHLKAVQSAFADADPVIAFSIKTNGNLAICRLMAEHGAGFDVTSGGELYRALRADPKAKIVFAGVGKTDAEMRYA